MFLIFTVTDTKPSYITENLTDWTGIFQSPSYPTNYAPNIDRYWLIQESDGNRIEITFQDFSVGEVLEFLLTNLLLLFSPLLLMILSLI